jgi:hypothetical protein
MYFFVLIVWLWTVWLPFVAWQMYCTVKASEEDLHPPLVSYSEDVEDVNKLE